MSAESLIKMSLRDRARVELLKAGHYDDLEVEWNPEKEDKPVEELIEFAEGRVDGHWEALQEDYSIPWNRITPRTRETSIEYNLRLLKLARNGCFEEKSLNSTENNTTGEQ